MSRNWGICNWNLRGINSQERCDDIANKVNESNCNILCLQETKREHFDSAYIRKFCPRRMNQFIYEPSIGNSGGIITIWNGNAFDGRVICQSRFQVTVELKCNFSAQIIVVTNIYAPCDNDGRQEFVNWFLQLDTSNFQHWIIMGDFNMIRSTEDRNRPGGNINTMLMFNNIIQTHDLEEIPLKGRAYTWSNMQSQPLLEKLDWIFTSHAWTAAFPNTMAIPLSRLGSDHIPIHIQIETTVPKAQIFRFEDFWIDFDEFRDVVQKFWQHTGVYKNAAQDVTARFKSLRHGIKIWSKSLSNLSALIDKCSYVLAMFDGIEEQRVLSVPERNFRTALKQHTAKLLEAKRLYWKKRANIRWAKLGDENTKFFHAIATRNYRHNHIACLTKDDGSIATEHAQKAAVLWNSFNNRLGKTDDIQMGFDLASLITPRDLSELELPVTTEEIDDIVKHMPSDKSPGPDGFNGLFMKKFWSLIKPQFYCLCNKFFTGNLDLTSINTAYIALIPKVQAPERPSDFRPISLISMGLKIITKILANRMQKVIISLLHKNQYGFIKTRTIQDCLAWAFEYLHLCHKSKKEIVIIKLDFEKAFDMVDYCTILSMLKHMGFGEVYLSWIKNILHTASTSIILNGVPGKSIKCRRGVRQGDPLSPLLFVATAELLQIAINKAWQDGILSTPLDNSYGQSYPILQYADDTLLIMPADMDEINSLKNILQTFSSSTGLKINYHKSSMVPINVPPEKCSQLAAAFGCKMESMPFTYLGLPMGTSRPKIDDLMPTICKIDRRLSGISNLLSYCSRIVVIKSVISAMPNHIMCALKVQYTHIDHMEKSMRTFLWHGKEIEKKGKCLVKWDNVCLPKDKGGLGILSLRDQNKALMMKNLSKFFNANDLPWVQLLWKAHYDDGSVPTLNQQKGSFWWRSCVSFLEDFKLLTTCKPGAGNSILLWKDKWNGDTLQRQFPQLHSFSHDKNISVQKAKQLAPDEIHTLFQLPLSMIASEQFDQLTGLLTDLVDNVDSDTWSFPWNNVKYSTSKVYQALLNKPKAPAPFQWIWKSPCLPKHKFFFWLMIQDRLNTKDLMERKKFYVESNTCVLCDSGEKETMKHLFFDCIFSQNMWGTLGQTWNSDLQFIDMLIDAKNKSTNVFFKIAMITGCWSIWNHRNKIIFDGEIRSLQLCYSFFVDSVHVIRHRIKPSLKEGMQAWLDHL